MNLKEYQKESIKNIIYPRNTQIEAISYCGLGLAEEAGEVVGKIKKIIRDNNGMITTDRVEAISLELGDVMWYVAALANELNLDLEDIAIKNVEKLNKRVEKGTLKGSGDNR